MQKNLSILSQGQVSFRPSFDLSELRSFVRNRILPDAAKWDQSEVFPVSILKELHQQGYMTAFIPQSDGGMGASMLEMVRIARELSYGSRGVACTLAAQMAALRPILDYGDSSLRARVLESVHQGALVSFCFTEPDAGSDAGGIRTKAVRCDGGYLLSGMKCFITNAEFSQHFVVIARTGDDQAASHSRLSAFYVPAGTPGLSCGSSISKIGFRDSNTAEVFLDNVFVPEGARLGNEGQGIELMLRTLQRSRTFLAAAAVGLCDRAFDLSTKYLESRIHYGKPLLDQPQIRAKLADMEVRAYALWLLTCESAVLCESGEVSPFASSGAKFLGGETAMAYASAAMDLFGAWGCASEYEIGRLFRDAKIFQVIEGPAFVLQSIIARELLSKKKANSEITKKSA